MSGELTELEGVPPKQVEAMREYFKNPSIKNVQLAKLINVHASTIARFKKTPIWKKYEEEKVTQQNNQLIQEFVSIDKEAMENYKKHIREGNNHQKYPAALQHLKMRLEQANQIGKKSNVVVNNTQNSTNVTATINNKDIDKMSSSQLVDFVFNGNTPRTIPQEDVIVHEPQKVETELNKKAILIDDKPPF